MCAHHVLRSNIETCHGSNYFGHPCMLGLALEYYCKNFEGGSKSVASKIEFWGLCARVAFLARAKFLRQPLITQKIFVSDRFIIFCVVTFLKTIVENGFDSPPYFGFRQGCLGTLKKMLGTSVFRGGGFQKSFFSILAKNIQNQKKFSKQKKFVF